MQTLFQKNIVFSYLLVEYILFIINVDKNKK